MELGLLIRQAREEQGLSVAQLAEAVGVTPTYLRELERGVKKNPSMQVISGMSDVLGKPVSYFFGKGEGTAGIRSLSQVREAVLGLNPAEMDDLVDYLHALKKRTESEDK